ncbi:MAG: TIR domain-containing protein [Alphaproteobacteria bacterium]|nr:TIR domain-containing protein [Alphaproteobacteria bacterium]MBM3651280.1 TIR domain-containing protein [Alphaproteobacteria bacterium]
MSDVFISYKHEERDRVVKIVDALELLSVDVWFDSEIQAGVKYEEKIKSELSQALAVLVCWSPAARESDWVRWEAKLAAHAKKMVPCFIEPCELPPEAALIQTKDISDWDGQLDHPGWLKTVEAIGRLIGREGLVSLQYAKSKGNHLDLLVWAQKYPDDKFADEAFATVARIEREQCNADLRELEAACLGAVRDVNTIAQERISSYASTFEGWLSDLRRASYAARPDLNQVLCDPKATLIAEAFGKLARQRDATLAEIAKEKDELERRRAELASRTVSSNRFWRIACIAMAVFLPVTSAVSYYTADRENKPDVMLLEAKVAEAEQQVKAANGDRDAAEMRRHELAVELDRLNYQIDDLKQHSESLNAQLHAKASALQQTQNDLSQALQQVGRLNAALQKFGKDVVAAHVEEPDGNAPRDAPFPAPIQAKSRVIPRCTLTYNNKQYIDAKNCHFA